MFMRCSCFLLIGVLAFTSCAPGKSATSDKVRSELRSALSLTSETDLFIGQIESGRLLSQFRIAYADYLRGEATRQAKDAQNARENSGGSDKAALCVEQLELLERELTSIRIQTDSKTLGEARRQVQTIRKRLIDAGAGR